MIVQPPIPNPLQRWWRDFQEFLQGLLPLLTLLLVLGLSLVHPWLSQLGMVVVFYWAVYRPDVLRLSMIIACGLLADMVRGTPLGWQTLLMLIAYLVAVRQRHLLTSKSFWQFWIGFAAISALTAATNWLFACLWLEQWLSTSGAFYSWATAFCLLPLGSYLLTWVHRCLPHA
jgi:rod shape-determining protein MreD